jgi:Nucleotide modification associated domain 2
MKILTYVVFYDFGFAPNPYFGFCTLATCKPTVRGSANIGDWVMGVASKRFFPNERRLVYAMKVTEKMSFTEYWQNPKFNIKKPIMNSSMKRSFGDNIYFFDQDKQNWHQEDSRHSLEDGLINVHHLTIDTSVDKVLISEDFYYFGEDAMKIPNKYSDYFAKTQGQKYIKEGFKIYEIIEWLYLNNFQNGIIGFPIETKNNKFQRLTK